MVRFSWTKTKLRGGQLARLPLLDDEPVSTELVIGPIAAKPLKLDIPLFVYDMSFGALSEEAKVKPLYHRLDFLTGPRSASIATWLGAEISKEAKLTHQERGYSSQIWYTP